MITPFGPQSQACLRLACTCSARVCMPTRLDPRKTQLARAPAGFRRQPPGDSNPRPEPYESFGMASWRYSEGSYYRTFPPIARCYPTATPLYARCSGCASGRATLDLTDLGRNPGRTIRAYRGCNEGSEVGPVEPPSGSLRTVMPVASNRQSSARRMRDSVHSRQVRNAPCRSRKPPSSPNQLIATPQVPTRPSIGTGRPTPTRRGLIQPDPRQAVLGGCPLRTDADWYH